MTVQLKLPGEVVVEITRQAAKGGLHNQAPGEERNLWAEYVLVLALAALLQEESPQSREEVRSMNIEEQMGRAIAEIVEVVHAVLPGGIMEVVSYLPPEKRKDKWGVGVDWDGLGRRMSQ